MATVMFSSSMFAQDTPPTIERPHWVVELVFGRKSMNCAGIGICRFAIHLTIADLTQLIGAVAHMGKIQIIMPPEFYKENTRNFPGGYLAIEEDYVIDLKTTRALGVADNYTIKKGKYRVIFDKANNTYNCTF